MNLVRFGVRELAPSKVVCIGRNYAEHISELGSEFPDDPVIFIKPNSAISDQVVVGPDVLHYEGEICFLLERGTFAGIGFGLDLTRRVVQSRLKEKGLPWERAKAFDGAAVFSAFVPLEAKVEDLRLSLMIDGAQVQAGGVDQMIYGPEDLLREIQSTFTLEDGDVLMSGTPKGVGEVRAGSELVGRVYAGDSLLVEGRWIARTYD